MKTSVKLKFILALPIVIFSLSSFNGGNMFRGKECDVVDVYEGVTPETNTKALTSQGLEEVSMILTPAKIKQGKYSFTVKRLAKDLYKVVGKDLYIETKYCYEYSTGDDVTLVVESSYGRFRGKILFK